MLLPFDELLLACLAVTLGATLQASTGFGAGLVSVPLLALIRPELVPGPILLASLLMTFGTACKHRGGIIKEHLSLVFLGLFFGAVGGALLVAQVEYERLSTVLGVVIFAAIAVSIAGVKIKLSGSNAFLAGTLAAVMGAAGGTGGTLLALFYQYEQGQRIRATLALLYFCGTVFILTMLFAVGRFGTQELTFGLQLIPGFVLGYCIAKPIATFLDQGYARTALLAVSTISVFILIGQGLG